MKQCRICGEWKPESEFYFRKGRNRYYNECKDCYKKHAKEYREKYRKDMNEYNREYYQKNRTWLLNQANQYYKANNTKINRKKRKSHRIYARKRRTNPKWKLNGNISNLINRSLKGNKNGLHWEEPVGYTLEDLMKRLEKQFTPEMNWKNQGSCWHIDHIVPVSVFNFDSVNHLDFKRCWALSNLRPLEKIQNLRKNSRIDKSFQPSLKI